MKFRSVFARAVYALSIFITVAGCLFVLYFGLRVFIIDTYPVNTGSMMPAIQPGSRIVVNKLIYGARLYKNLDFLDGGKLQTLRIKGSRGISYNDVVVFNRAHPMEFDITKVYVKRCIGLPGDTIWIRNGKYQNSSVNDGVILKHFTAHNSQLVSDSPMQVCFPYSETLGWTTLNFGPLYLPRKGDCIALSPTNTSLYRRIMTYENGVNIRYSSDTVFLHDQPIQVYTFQDSYYFMAGDNFADSSDSRFFGPVPEAFIIGVVPLKNNDK